MASSYGAGGTRPTAAIRRPNPRMARARRAARARWEHAVLVVDCDPNVSTLLSDPLLARGFKVHRALDGDEAVDRAREVHPAAMILEVQMPGLNDFELLARLRDHGVTAPALFLSTRNHRRDKIIGLSIGGDGYMTKPFHPEEVAARLRAVLRRRELGHSAGASPNLSYADLELNVQTLEASRAGMLTALTFTEFQLLRFLMVNAGIALSKQAILDHVWRAEPPRSASVVQSYICYLRRKVDNTDQPLTHTVRGVGYIMRAKR